MQNYKQFPCNNNWKNKSQIYGICLVLRKGSGNIRINVLGMNNKPGLLRDAPGCFNAESAAVFSLHYLAGM